MVFPGCEVTGKKYKCQLCPSSYATTRTLQRHERDQHGEQVGSTLCQTCFKIFKNISSRDTHMRAVHGIRKR
jgi:hypothetical protein